MQIGNLHIRNFITFKDQVLNLKSLGLVLLKGDNKDEPEKGASASGKTILGDAIHWLWDGHTTRDILADSVIGEHGKWASVEADVESGTNSYRAARYRKHPEYHNSFHIYHDSDVSHRCVADTEERLKIILGHSFNLYRLSSFYNADSKYHFSRMNSAMRGKILDEIVGAEEADVPARLKKINKMIKDAKAEIQTHLNDEALAEQKVAHLKQVIAMNEQSLANGEANYKKQVEALKFEVAALLPAVSQETEIAKRLDQFVVEFKQLEKQERVLEEIKRQRNDKDVSLSVERQRLSDHKTAIGNIARRNPALNAGVRCDKCGNLATEGSLNELRRENAQEQANVAALMQACSVAMENLQGQIATLDTSMAAINVSQRGILLQESSRLQEKRSQIEIHKATIQTKHDQIANAEQSFQKQMSDYQVHITAAKDELVGVNRNLKEIYYIRTRKELRLENLEHLASFYGPEGFRPMVMASYSPVLSDSANYFLKDFTGGREVIQISSTTQLSSGAKEIRDKVDIRVVQRGKSKSFPNEFCAGENGAIDLSMNFGVMHLAAMKSAVDSGFVYMDEITHGLSAKLVDQLMYILKNKFCKPGMTVIMTTHRPIPERLFDHVWCCVRENGVSRIEIER